VSNENLKFSANAEIDLSFNFQDTSTYFDHAFGSASGHLIKISLEGKLRNNMDYVNHQNFAKLSMLKGEVIS